MTPTAYQKQLKQEFLERAQAIFEQVMVEEGYQKAKELLALAKPPEAIFTSNALLSAGAFRALKESGLAIPNEIAFASFDETRWGTLVEPPVTVIEQPTYEN